MHQNAVATPPSVSGCRQMDGSLAWSDRAARSQSASMDPSARRHGAAPGPGPVAPRTARRRPDRPRGRASGRRRSGWCGRIGRRRRVPRVPRRSRNPRRSRPDRPAWRRPCCRTTTGPVAAPSPRPRPWICAVSCSRTMSRRGTPTTSSLGVSSFPVSDRPASFQPTLIHGPMPRLKTDRLAGHAPFDGDDVIARRRRQVVGVGDPEVPVRGRRWAGDQVRAAALDGDPARGLRRPHGPDLLDRRGEQRERVHARTLGRSVDLLDQPRRPGAASRPDSARPGPAARRASARAAGRASKATASRSVGAVATPTARPTSRCDPDTRIRGMARGDRCHGQSSVKSSGSE